MDFNLERSQAHAIKNMDFSNDSREELESMAEELYEKYDEIEKLKKQIEKLKQENEKLKKQENNVVNKDIRWGLVGTKEDDVNDAISEIAELYLKKDEEKEKTEKKKIFFLEKVNRDLDQIGRWIRRNHEDYDDWSYDDEKEKLEIYVGDHTERYTRQELVECGVLYD
tara:strand:+ start:1526 stop:2029 length:504 start_codon:yes stop_codon:yes gene_type:complete